MRVFIALVFTLLSVTSYADDDVKTRAAKIDAQLARVGAAVVCVRSDQGTYDLQNDLNAIISSLQYTVEMSALTNVQGYFSTLCVSINRK